MPVGFYFVFIYACDFQTTCNYTWLSKKDSYEFLGKQNSHQLVAPISAILEGIKSTCSPVFVFVLFFLFQYSQKNWHSCFFFLLKWNSTTLYLNSVGSYKSNVVLCLITCHLDFTIGWLGYFHRPQAPCPPPQKQNKNTLPLGMTKGYCKKGK